MSDLAKFCPNTDPASVPAVVAYPKFVSANSIETAESGKIWGMYNLLAAKSPHTATNNIAVIYSNHYI